MSTAAPPPAGSAQLRCYNPYCRHTWFQRSPKPPDRCPRCQSRQWFNPIFTFQPPQTRRQTPPTPEPMLPLELPLQPTNPDTQEAPPCDPQKS